MKPINDNHVARHGLAVVEIAADDDATAFAVQNLLAAHCALAPADRTTRDPGEPGVPHGDIVALALDTFLRAKGYPPALPSPQAQPS